MSKRGRSRSRQKPARRGRSNSIVGKQQYRSKSSQNLRSRSQGPSTDRNRQQHQQVPHRQSGPYAERQRVEQNSRSSRAPAPAADDDLDMDSLKGYIEELKAKMTEPGNKSGSGSAPNLSVHKLSKMKRRIYDALDYDRSAHVTTDPGRPKKVKKRARNNRRTRKIRGRNPYVMSGGHRRRNNSAADDWLDEFETTSLRWLQRRATYVRPGPGSGRMERAFPARSDSESADCGDPYGHMGALIRRPPRPARRVARRPRKFKKPKPTLGRSCMIRNDGR